MNLSETRLPVPDNEAETIDDLEQAIALAWKAQKLLRKAG
jgi:hypothetical protein